MTGRRLPQALSRFLSDYGMSLVLLLLCIYYSAVTFALQDPSGAYGGEKLADQLAHTSENPRILIVTRDTREDNAFADALFHRLDKSYRILGKVRGSPADARTELQRFADSGEKLDLIAAPQSVSEWAVLQHVSARFPQLGDAPVVTPRRYWWPNFLKADNLRKSICRWAV
jgi:hypothetical protein